MACNDLFSIDTARDAGSSTKYSKIIGTTTTKIPRTGSHISLFSSISTVASESDAGTTTTLVTPKRRRVSFSRTKDTMHSTISRHSISSEEYHAAWYSRADLKAISNICRQHIRLMTQGEELFQDKDFCVRGLESLTPIKFLVKQKTRSSSIEATLLEQCRQFEEYIVDEDAIRSVYHSSSASCQFWAQTVALKDQREADVIHDDFSEMPPSTTILLKKTSPLTLFSKKAYKVGDLTCTGLTERPWLKCQDHRKPHIALAMAA